MSTIAHEFQTVNNLPFEVAPWHSILNIGEGWERFRVGTCHGLWRCTSDAYEILAVGNDNPGNGHFEDVMQWFEHSCKRDKRILRICEVWNKDFKEHLIGKRGFRREGKSNAIKKF